MALTNQGRIELQNQIKNTVTKIKYVYTTYNSSGTVIAADQESATDDVAFLDANASAGLVMSSVNEPSFPITISSFGASVARVSITGLRLYNTAGTTDYMEVDFDAAYDFVSDGNFNITLLTVSFT